MADSTPRDDIRDVLLDRRPQMLRRARQLLRSPEEADDVVQDAVLSLLEAPHILAGVERLGAWLMTFIARRCVDMIRRNVRRREQALPDAPLADESTDAATAAAGDEFLEALADIVPALPPDQRDVFIAHVLEERPYRELAAESGTPEGTLMARNHRALQRVRAELARRGLGPDDY